MRTPPPVPESWDPTWWWSARACADWRFPSKSLRTGSVQRVRGHRELLDDRAECEGREEGEAADDDDDAHHESDEQAAGGRESAGRDGNGFLRRQRSRDRHGRNDHPEPADEHRDGAGDVVEQGIS